MPTDFVFPEGATAPVALAASKAFYASPDWRELLPYCGALDAFLRAEPEADLRGRRPSRGWSAVSGRVPADRLLPIGRAPRWQGDVVLVGECARQGELDLMSRLIEGLVRSGRGVLYVYVNGMERRYLRAAARARGWGRRLTLAGVRTAEYAPGNFWLHPGAWRQLARDRALMEPLLGGSGAHLWRDARPALREIALAKVQWRRLKAGLRFGAAVVRTRYLPLSAALLADSVGSPHLTVSLQHSIVTSPASFAPVTARRYVCFGATSRAVLEAIDAGMAREAGRPAICGDLALAGSLVDAIPEVSAPRGRRAVLVIDQTSPWAPRFFGGGDAQHRALPRAVEALAGRARNVDRVVVRLHPAYGAAPAWPTLRERLPDRVELSPGDRALEEDLKGASVVVGLFSTVLPVAAAAGLPTLFVRRDGWFYTPDLGGFVPEQFVTPESLVDRVDNLLGDERRYRDESERCLAAGSLYFAGGRRCDFDASFVERLLAPVGEP